MGHLRRGGRVSRASTAGNWKWCSGRGNTRAGMRNSWRGSAFVGAASRGVRATSREWGRTAMGRGRGGADAATTSAAGRGVVAAERWSFAGPMPRARIKGRAWGKAWGEGAIWVPGSGGPVNERRALVSGFLRGERCAVFQIGRRPHGRGGKGAVGLTCAGVGGTVGRYEGDHTHTAVTIDGIGSGSHGGMHR